MAPRRAVLEQHLEAGRVATGAGQQQAGRPEEPPVPVTLPADDPAVSVAPVLGSPGGVAAHPSSLPHALAATPTGCPGPVAVCPDEPAARDSSGVAVHRAAVPA